MDKKNSKNLNPKCGAVTLVFGLIFLLMAIMCTFFRLPIKNTVDFLIQQQTALTEESMMTGLWKNPPLKPTLEVFIFNVTNSEEFLAGKEKLNVQEIGPYVYSAPTVRIISRFQIKIN